MIKASRFMNEKDPHSTAVMLLLQPGRVTWGALRRQPPLSFSRQGTGAAHVDHSYVEHLIATGGLPRTGADSPQSQCAADLAGRQDEPKIDFAEYR
jgi:hypothetical protein